MGHALTSGGSEAAVAAQPAAAAPMQPAPAQQAQACQFEFKQFLECTQTQSDISLCQGFNEVFRQCQQANGMQELNLFFFTLLLITILKSSFKYRSSTAHLSIDHPLHIQEIRAVFNVLVHKFSFTHPHLCNVLI